MISLICKAECPLKTETYCVLCVVRTELWGVNVSAGGHVVTTESKGAKAVLRTRSSSPDVLFHTEAMIGL